jgi:hypothetical protein
MAHWLLPLPFAVTACGTEQAGEPAGTVTPRPTQYWGAGTAADAEPLAGARVSCYCDPSPTNPSPQLPAAIAELLVEPVPGGQALHARLTLNPAYADNTYGANAVGWSGGHEFKDLVGSDAAALGFHDDTGTPVLVFHLDYLAADKASASGFGSLGVSGGDGRMVSGDPAAVLKHSTSMSLNLNQRGYGRYTMDSPTTNQSLAADPAAPGWDFRVVYEAWVATSIFGTRQLGFLNVPYLHVSPSKTGIKQTPLTPCGCPAQVASGAPTPVAACPSGVASCDAAQAASCPGGSSCVGSCCVPAIQ